MNHCDLSAWFPVVSNQMDTRTCVAVAAAATREYYARLNGDYNALSPQFLHYQSRRARPDFQQYTGTTIDDVLVTMVKHGVAPLSDCPNCIENPNQAPTIQAYQSAEAYKISAYRRFFYFDDVLESLANQHPVIFVIGIFSTFFADATTNHGKYIEPPKQYKPTHSHCVVAVGYDLNKQVLKVRNSFGPNWGDKGYFYLPFDLAKQKRIAGYYRGICV